MGALAAGANGIYTFNLWDSQHPIFREGGGMDTLLLRDKDYFVNPFGLGSPFGLPYAKYRKHPRICPAAPLEISSGETVEIDIPMHDDLEKAASLGHTPVLTLRIQARDTSPADLGLITLNTSPIPPNSWKTQDGWLEAELPVSAFRQGKNTLALKLPTGSRSVTISDLMLRVRYPTVEQTKTNPEEEIHEA